jgi:hypothetical protein
MPLPTGGRRGRLRFGGVPVPCLAKDARHGDPGISGTNKKRVPHWAGAGSE